MNRINFLENRDFLIHSTARPYVVEPDHLVNLEIMQDMTMLVTTQRQEIFVKETPFKSSVLPILGITGLLKKKMIDGESATLTDSLLDLITPIMKQNIQSFIFFLDTDEKEAIAVFVTPVFDKLEPVTLHNGYSNLKQFLCTSYFPVEEDKDYHVIDFNHEPKDKIFKLNLAHKEDQTKEFYPIIHNNAPIAWKENWDQRASIYDRERDLYMTLPRNYGKGGYKVVDKIIQHIDHMISKLDITQDYDKEFNEMLMAKLPNKGIEYMMEASFEDHKLVTILDKISSSKEDLKPSVVHALYKCLGYMVAQKLHCCPECRHLDEETL